MCNKTIAYFWKDCLFNGEVILKSQQIFKSNHHKVYTEEVNKIAFSSDDDKRLQAFDGNETYPYGTNAFKVSESEMMTVSRFSALWSNDITTTRKEIK